MPVVIGRGGCINASPFLHKVIKTLLTYEGSFEINDEISGVQGILKVAILKVLSSSKSRERERYPVSFELNVDWTITVMSCQDRCQSC
jgi:hypothetical protein